MKAVATRQFHHLPGERSAAVRVLPLRERQRGAHVLVADRTGLLVGNLRRRRRAKAVGLRGDPW